MVRVLQSPMLRLRDLASVAPASARGFSLVAMAGRLCELSNTPASARLTAAFGLVLEAQQAGEPAAWVLVRGSSFLPRDAADGGIDLASLAVVRAADAAKAGRAAEQLARSGAFGLIVIDLDRAAGALSGHAQAAILTRLAGLAQKHETAIVFLTDKPAATASISSLVSLRAEAARGVVKSGALQVRVAVLKDKRRGPGATWTEACRGPAGLR